MSDIVACMSPDSPREREEPRLRRSHRKSRAGCKPCKVRRVKCDERRPFCSHCNRRGVSCEYYDTPISSVQAAGPRVQITSRRSPRKAVSPTLDATAMTETESRPSHDLGDEPYSRGCITPLNIVGTPVDRFLDLRLFHHYVYMASVATQSQTAWLTWIANTAMRNSNLMDAVLGFSAFHLRQLNMPDPSIRAASHMYMARAIRAHNRELKSGISSANADIVLAVAALVMFHASVNEPYLRGGKDEHRLPLHWFRPFHGAGTLFSEVWPLIRDRDLRELLRVSMKTWPGPSQTKTSNNFDFLLHDIDPQIPDDIITAQAYHLAVANLSYIYSSPQNAKILQFPALVSARFIELLEQKDPRALAISGYFFMLLKVAQPLWWVDGAPQREFRAIMAFLPKTWWPVMDWAIREFGWSYED